MSKVGPWSVKGVDREARDLAREAAESAGLTIGAWLDRAIRDNNRYLAPPPERPALPGAQVDHARAGDHAGAQLAPVLAAAERAGFSALADDVARAEDRLKDTVVPVALKVQQVARRLVELEQARPSPAPPAAEPAPEPEPEPAPDRPEEFPRIVSEPVELDSPEEQPQTVPCSGFQAELDRAWQEAERAEPEAMPPPAAWEPERRSRLRPLAASMVAFVIGAAGSWSVLTYSDELGLPGLGPPLAQLVRDTVDQVVVLADDLAQSWRPDSNSAPQPTAAAPPMPPPAVADSSSKSRTSTGSTTAPQPSAAESKAAVMQASLPAQPEPTPAPQPSVARASAIPPAPAASVPSAPARPLSPAPGSEVLGKAEPQPLFTSLAPAPEPSAGGKSTDDLETVQLQARQGNPSAQHDLAVLYARGDLGQPDYNKAAYWFREAAVQGLANAQYNLGVLYEQGLGVAQDDVRALLWYHSAAEQGHARAQFNLGVFYADGRGLPVDYAEAAKWLHLAADQGLARAFYNLAIMNERGLGMPANPVAARAYLGRAALLGDDDARRRLAQSMPKSGDAAGDAATKTAAGPELVGAIQHYLYELKIDPGRADGVLGERTKQAIRRFESESGMPVTGVPTTVLLERLMSRVNQPSAASTE